jgi:DNA-binding LacI/PurR family transcriptional regulator
VVIYRSNSVDRKFDRSTPRSRARERRSVVHPTLTTVAEAAGVSRQTVSNILNAPHRVQRETRDRVMAEIERQGYRPNRSARSLRTRRSHLLGYCVPPPSAGSAVMDRFLHALTDAAERRGYHVLLFTQPLDGPGPRSAYEALLGHQAVDGFVLSETTVGDTRQAWLHDRAIPFAAFGRRFAEPEIGSWVDVDGAAGTAAAVHHLAVLGHRRLAFIGWPAGSGVGDDRRRGFLEATAAASLDVAGTEHGLNGVDSGRTMAERLLALGAPPTAIVCVSDLLALGCDAAVRASGRTPGRDIAITGFDDSPAAGLPSVGLTTLRQPLDTAGEHVVRLLVDRLDDPDAPDEQILLEPTLVVRASTDPTHSPPSTKGDSP